MNIYLQEDVYMTRVEVDLEVRLHILVFKV
jgi:hypothetical protein